MATQKLHKITASIPQDKQRDLMFHCFTCMASKKGTQVVQVTQCELIDFGMPWRGKFGMHMALPKWFASEGNSKLPKVGTLILNCRLPDNAVQFPRSDRKAIAALVKEMSAKRSLHGVKIKEGWTIVVFE